MLVALSCLFAILGFLAGSAGSLDMREINQVLRRLWHRDGSLWEDLRRTKKPRETRNPSSANVSLLTKHNVETQFDMDSWQRLAYEDFKTTILAPKGAGLRTFPCIYATMGYRSDDHRYLFLESDNPAEPRNVHLIGPALKSYLALATELGPNTSLVIIGAPSPARRSVEEYNSSFWDMLRGLRIWDAAPWPREVPHATASEKWTFCFDGQPVFPVMLTPAHIRRWSRHMSVPLIALQPKWVLDRLLSSPEKREAATGKVRKLLVEYDQVGISPDLTTYGQPGSTEAKQLCLLDENQTADCPYGDLDR